MDSSTPTLVEDVRYEVAQIRILSSIEGEEVEVEVGVEMEGEEDIVRSKTRGELVKIVSTTQDGRKIIGWSKDDPENPHNFSMV